MVFSLDKGDLEGFTDGAQGGGSRVGRGGPGARGRRPRGAAAVYGLSKER